MIFKKIASYFTIQMVEKSSSEHNPVLEVIYTNGRYMLNSDKVNYAFGSLDKVWRVAFRKTEISKRKIKRVLILGLGPGNIASILNGEKQNYEITGVEWDPEVIRLGKKYFDLEKVQGLNIVVADAIPFAENCREKFDLICIDLFQDEVIPRQAEKESWLLTVKDLLNPGGIMLYNRLMHTVELEENTRAFTGFAEKVLPGLTHIKADTNRILIFEKI